MLLEYYQNSRGDCAILDFINNLPDKRCKNAILTRLDDLQELGLSNLFKIKAAEKIGANLYELRCRYGKNIFRLLFGIVDSRAYISVIFQKKRQKIDKRYINLANKRIKEKINI